MTETMKITLIYGSTREGRLCDTVAEWVKGQIIKHPEFELDMIDPVGMDLPWRHEAQDGPALVEIKNRIDRSDAFVILTPEYNHSYPAALKFIIDSAYEEWRAKPVAFVSYGGISGGLRAVEHLRLVFAELQAVGIRNTVSFADVWDHLNTQGRLVSPPGQEKAMHKMLAQLHWWALALRQARDSIPYGKAA